VKRALSSGPSSRGSSTRNGDNGSQDSTRSSSFVPSSHGTTGLIHYHAHNNIPMATDGDDFPIHTTAEMEKASHHPPNHRLGKTLRRASSWFTSWKGSDDFATVQTEMQASIDLQTCMMCDLFSHFGINPDA
jgi:hypothetical protein